MATILDSVGLKGRSYLEGEKTNICCAPLKCQELFFMTLFNPHEILQDRYYCLHFID